MPLRDLFRPPLDKLSTWEEFYGQWPAVIVQQLRTKLPPGYVSGPRVHSGSQVEVDFATFEKDEWPSQVEPGRGGVATAVWTLAQPSVAVETELSVFDEYEVRIYDAKRGRRLVAAIELVSPANKDRPDHRNEFIGKCAALVRKGVAVSIVDLVTVRHFNLYAELLDFIGHSDETLSVPPSPLYAASVRLTKRDKQPFLEAWSHEMALGQALPTLPLWIGANLVVPLDLESSYEQTCIDLSIT